MKPPKDELPPTIPERLLDIDVVVRLLGHLMQHDQLKPDAKQQLRQLIGALPPSKKHAETWKRNLKALAREMRDMGDTAPQPRVRKRVVEAQPRTASQQIYRAPDIGH